MKRVGQPLRLGGISWVLAALALLATIVPAAAAEGAPAQEAPPPPGRTTETAAYRLQPGDEVSIAVLPRKEFDCAGLILPDGMLYLPNIGGLKAAGMTIPELAGAVRKVLEEELVEPRVTVALARMAPPPAEKPARPGTITLIGAVPRTGPLPLEMGLRVRRALDLAGGTDPDADLTQIVILHADLTRTLVDLSTDERVSNPAHNRLLQDGDSIEIRRKPVVRKEASRVRISGEVQTPGPYDLRDGMTLEDLIIAAGKLRPLADVERVELHRPGKPVTFFNLEALRKQGPAGKVLLQSGDEVYVHEQASRIALIGAVQNPGPRALKPGLKLRELMVGGAADIVSAANPAVVDLGAVQLLRGGKPALKLNLREVLRKPEHRDNIALESGDVLFFPPRKGLRRNPLDYVGQLGSLGFLFGLF